MDALVGGFFASKKGRRPGAETSGRRKPQVSVNKRRSESMHMPKYIFKRSTGSPS